MSAPSEWVDEDAERRRLVGKWICEDLTEEEMDELPVELIQQIREHIRSLVNEGQRSAEKGGWLDGPKTLAEIGARVTARHRQS